MYHADVHDNEVSVYIKTILTLYSYCMFFLPYTSSGMEAKVPTKITMTRYVNEKIHTVFNHTSSGGKGSSPNTIIKNYYNVRESQLM